MQFNHDQIPAMAQGGFFGVGNAQLPSSRMLMIDRILDITDRDGDYGKGRVEADLTILPDHWFFGCHFKNDPVMPGCLGLDALWQLLGVFLGWCGLPGRGRALCVGKVRFSGQIYPDAGRIRYIVHIKRVFKKPMALGIADGMVVHKDRTIYQASDLTVGLIHQDS